MCRFKESIAVEFGVNAALIADFLWQSICDEYYDEKVVEIDGQYWCRCSMLMITGVFSFMSRYAVKQAIDLIEKDVSYAEIISITVNSIRQAGIHLPIMDRIL